MNDLETIPQHWVASLEASCSWLTDTAMIKTKEHGLAGAKFRFVDEYSDWRGAFRGEYSAAQKRWGMFCPIWHGGQGVKALAYAYEATSEVNYLKAAKDAAGFILRHQIREQNDPDFGLILGYESGGSVSVNTSAILECVDGLVELSRITGDAQYADAAIDALRWVRKRMYLPEKATFYSDYNPKTRSVEEAKWARKFHHQSSTRPLNDDGCFITAYELTGEASFLEMSISIADLLLFLEDPAGNWKCIIPSNQETGVIHPRQAFWFGRPMWKLFQHTGEQKYLDCCRRAAQWYVQAMRRDGGIFRETDGDFNTPSFGHEISGIACAGILWMDLIREFNDTQWIEPLQIAMSFCKSVQFVDVADDNLKGAILEKVLPPNGSDAPPWHLRDLGTIFYVMLLSMVMRDKPDILPEENSKLNSWSGA